MFILLGQLNKIVLDFNFNFKANESRENLTWSSVGGNGGSTP